MNVQMMIKGSSPELCVHAKNATFTFGAASFSPLFWGTTPDPPYDGCTSSFLNALFHFYYSGSRLAYIGVTCTECIDRMISSGSGWGKNYFR